MLLIRFISYLPFSVLYLLADGLYVLLEYVVKYRRDVIMENLRNSFADKPDEELTQIRKEFYKNLADVFVEALKALTISPEALLSRVSFIGLEELMHHNRNNESVIGICGHHANWEWLLLASSLACQPYQIKGIYKKVQNPFFEKLMFTIRSRFGAKLVELDQVKEILSNRQQPMLIAMVADQVPGSTELNYWTSFLNQDTVFYEGPARIARLRKAQVFFLGMIRIKRGYYQVKVEKLASPEHIYDSASVIEPYRDKLEALTHQQPANWLWSHRRWKYKRPQATKK